jgi:hypothetical protein
MTDLITIELNRNTRICSFIENMYTNIPKNDTINIINNILESNSKITMNIQKEILHILQTVIEQNYFQFDQQYYKQTDGLTMGAPTSSVLAETYVLQWNYFQFDQQYYKQTDGLTMSAPTSSVLAETYVQHMEHKQIYPVLIKQQIIAYFRYVDDILIIYDRTKQTFNKY